MAYMFSETGKTLLVPVKKEWKNITHSILWPSSHLNPSN